MKEPCHHIVAQSFQFPLEMSSHGGNSYELPRK